MHIDSTAIMQKIKLNSTYEFRTVTVNVALDHFLQKCGHQHCAHDLRDCCFCRLKPEQKFQEGLVGGGGSN